MRPDNVRARLSKLRSNLRTLITFEGLARLVVVVGLLAILTFLFDWATPLPAVLRLILTIISVLVIVVTFWRSLILPLAGRMSDDRVALAAERRFPEFKDSLISTVQLSRLGPDEGFFNSPELVESLIEETEEEMRDRKMSGVFSAASVLKFWFFAVIFVIIIGSFIAEKPLEASLYIKRYLTPFSAPDWPKYNRLEVIDLVQTVAKGDDVEIKVNSVGRQDPSTVTIYSKFESQSGWEESLMLKFGTSSFKRTFENVNEPFWFYAVGGDAQTQRYRIDVKIRPHVEDLRLWLKYPKYTGIPDTPKDEPETTGNVRVPGGTVIEFVATSNNILKRAHLRGEGIEPVEGKDKWEVEEIEAGKIFRGSFIAKKSSHYTFELVDADGFDNFTNNKPVTYNLRVVVDRSPAAKITKPARNNMMTPNAILPLDVDIRDEYGLRDAVLKFYKIRESETSEPEEQSLVFIGKDGQPIKIEGETEAVFCYDFELEPLKAKLGDTVIYYAEASDFNDASGREPGRSRKWKISIVSAEELRRAYQDRLVRLKDRLISIKHNQELGMDRVTETSQKVAVASNVDKDLQRELLNAELDQHRITRELEGTVDELDAIVEGSRANKLYSEQDYEVWSGYSSRIGDLAKRISPEIAEGVYKLRKEKPEEGYEKEFDLIYKKQAGLISELAEIIRELERIADFNEVIRIMRRLADQERQLRDEIRKKLLKEKGEGEEKTFSDEDKEKIEELITLLSDSDSSVRKDAVEELRKLTGKNFEYDPDGNEQDRASKTMHWEEWWKLYKEDK